MEQADDEAKRLKACVNNLTSMLVLPAIWSGGGSQKVIGDLLDVMSGMLKLDFVHAEFRERADAAAMAVAR